MMPAENPPRPRPVSDYRLTGIDMSYITSKPGKTGKRWQVVFQDPRTGKKRWKAAGSRRKDAEALKRRIDGEIAAGTFEKYTDISFNDFADKWLSDYAAIRLKASSRIDCEQVTRNHLKPFFGKYLLKNIAPGMVQNYISTKIKEGLSPRTVIKTVAILHEMFKHAIVWGYLRDNPTDHAEKPRLTRKEMAFLGREQVLKFLAASSPEYYPLFAAAVLTGARQGELLALRWQDVDLDRQAMFIRRTYHPTHGFSELKTRSGERSIVISSELVRILRLHKKRSNGNPEVLVFQNKAGNPINPQNMMTREFYPALKRADLPRIRFHDLRHTFAAIMIAMGENIKFIQKQLGHASITVTLDTYGHLLLEVSEGFGQRLDSFVFSSNVLQFPSPDLESENPEEPGEVDNR
jgi:integrase